MRSSKMVESSSLSKVQVVIKTKQKSLSHKYYYHSSFPLGFGALLFTALLDVLNRTLCGRIRSSSRSSSWVLYEWGHLIPCPVTGVLL